MPKKMPVMTDDPSAEAVAPSYEAPRARPRIGLARKLFYYLALFTLFVLTVVWVMQIGLLNYFYRQSKYGELDRVDRAVMEAVRRSDDGLQEIIGDYASEYAICVRVFRLDASNAREVASSDVSGDCIIHHGVSDEFLTYLYNQAVNSGGVYTKQLTRDSSWLEQHGVLTPPPMEREHSGGMGEKLEHLRDQFSHHAVNVLRVRVTEGEGGKTYIVLLNSALMPLHATVTTLKTQFWMIAVILLISAMVLAVLLSRNICRPIEKMNVAAKRLSEGRYDADFRVDGFREVMELSDSLTYASRELSQSDILQKELLANISHDLRTPLTMIVGYGEVMRDLPGENTPENVQVIIDETERLSGLVNDLLDLSKLQAGSRRPTPERFNLTETIRATMTRYEKLTQKDGYRIEYACDESVSVVADRTMILQVVYNLINNAVNYTGDDKLVRVTQAVSADRRYVRVSITDSGEGIAPDEISLIWDRYYKVDKVHRRAMVGTGLGLSIVKQILEAHGTTYGVESRLGEGSTFWFDLPVDSITDSEI